MSSLDARSVALRHLVIRALRGPKRGHVGSALSLIEIFRVLYDDVLRVDASRPDWVRRDRCILSKGHGCLALYAILADKGFFATEELDRFCSLNGMLGGHPEYGKIPGVEASTGALGHGLSIGVGEALAARMQGRDDRVFVIVGDGELNEGSVWEAAMSAHKHALSSLTLIIDSNKLQAAGPVREVLDMDPLADKWRAFGFSVAEVDGHDVGALRKTFAELPLNDAKPTAVIAHTVKGKGFSFAEHQADWHHKLGLTEADFLLMETELAQYA
jgi:transketolase